MKKITTFFLMVLMAVPFLQSCNSESDGADQIALITVRKSLDAAGFYGMLDNGMRLYPGVMRVNYEPSNELQRALVYFKEINEPVPGYDINADVYNVSEILTKRIEPIFTADADTLKQGIEIISASIGGNFLNIEFRVNVDPYNSNQKLTVGLIDNHINGTPEYDKNYPLELGFSCYPPLSKDGYGYTITSMACFYLGDGYSLEEKGCEGYEIKYSGFELGLETQKSYIVTPNTVSSMSNMQ